MSAFTTKPAAGSLAYFDLYEIVQDMAGASAPLYRGRKIGSRLGDVVVRPLPRELRTDAKLYAQARDSFSRIASLRHPNIVPVLGLHDVSEVRYVSEDAHRQIGVEAGDVLVVAEFAQGRRLDDWRASFPEGAMPLDSAVEAVRQICAALGHAHRRGVLHQDLKPANVMVARRTGGRLSVRVMDFCPAPEHVEPESGELEAYMAPEVLDGRGGTTASDQYSAAMLFLFLMTGRTSLAELSRLPAPVAAVARRALASDPAARYPSCADFAGALVAAAVRSARGAGPVAVFRALQVLNPRVRLGLHVFAYTLFAVAGVIGWRNVAVARRAEAQARARASSAAAAAQAAKAKAAAEKSAREQAEAEKKVAEQMAAEKAVAAKKAADAEAAARAQMEAARVAAEQAAAAERTAAEKVAHEKAAADAQAARARAVEARRRATELALARFGQSDWTGALAAVKGADLGNPRLQYNLALCFLEGRATATNATAAVALLRQAAAKDVPDAVWTLAQCLDRGEGAKRDPAEAARLRRRAADLGHPRAQYAMGLNCIDPQQAAAWIRKAADQGYAPAQAKYGDCCIAGIGVPKDSTEAVKWYTRAADRGDAGGQRALGYCYDSGAGVREDAGRAVELYRQASEGGDLLAQALLSQCLFLGLGVPRDYDEAGRLARASAEGGNAFGQYMAGLCCETGHGAIRSRLKAKAWYEKAIAQGLECARARLEKMKIQ